MRLSNYKLYILFWGWVLAFPLAVQSKTLSFEGSKDTLRIYDRRTETEMDSIRRMNDYYKRSLARYQRFWSNLVPNQIKVQYAGSIGAASIGMGWHYGKERRVWETDFMVGYIPRFESRAAKATLTLKQSYVPFRINLYKNMKFEPLSCGIFFNTVLGHQFWTKEPAKYPHHYYGFSTRIRTNIFIGERLRYEIPSYRRKHSKSISIYYELSTCDLYLVSYVPNSYIPLKDVLSLALGIEVELF